MARGQPAVWVFFSGVLGRRPSYKSSTGSPGGTLPLAGNSISLLHTSVIGWEEATFPQS